MENKYLVVIKDSYTRDIQVAQTPEIGDDVASDEWRDFTGAVVVGIFTAESEEYAINEAAAYADVSIEVLKAYNLK